VKLTETLTIYPVTADEFGDSVQGTTVDVSALTEEVRGWGHGVYADTNSGELTAWIKADHGFDPLAGLEAAHNGSRYRITSVKPTASLVTGEPDLVELGLDRLEADGS
jgi:hypothetical protein